MDKKELIQKISSSKVIIKKTTHHKNGDTTIRIGKEETMIKDNQKPGVNTESEHAPKWFVNFTNNLDNKFENIDKKFENIDKKFENIDKKFQNIDKKFENIESKFENIERKFENIERKFENIDSKLDNHIKDFELFRENQETFNKKILSCPTIAAEFQKSKTQE